MTERSAKSKQYHVYVSWETTEEDRRLGSMGERQIRPVQLWAEYPSTACNEAKAYVHRNHPHIQTKDMQAKASTSASLAMDRLERARRKAAKDA